jgi:PAS domain-containing protein
VKGEIYYSKEWQKRLGIDNLSPKEAFCSLTDLVHPDDIARIKNTYFHACEQKASKVSIEFRIETVDSGYIWVSLQIRITYNQDGEPIRFSGTHIDITKRKKAEEVYARMRNKRNIFLN